jgi:RNA polymerase sigma-70 factor (ECF subfamily)
VPLDPSADSTVDAAAPAVADPMEQATLRKALDTALAGIRPEQRAALTLRYEEGLSFAEIGQILGIPEATARSHVHRARRDLSACLSEAGWGPSERLQRNDAAVRKP